MESAGSDEQEPSKALAVLSSEESRPESTKEPSMNQTRTFESNLSSIDVALTYETLYHPIPTLEEACYLAAFSVFGSSLRVFLGRLFGDDCDASVEDFLQTISPHFCITTNGTTDQRGGALFAVLPANMLGSFFLGIIHEPVHVIPWLSKHHPLQSDDAFASALKVGFCGSLTSVSSWNTQMVVMMEGTHAELGSQIVPALFGYLLGFATCCSSFSFGRLVSTRIKARARGRSTSQVPLEEDMGWFTPVTSLALFVALTVAYVVGDVVAEIDFYRSMWMGVLLAPFGTYIRRCLVQYNKSTTWLPWFPWGTFLANVLACFIAATTFALASEHLDPDHRNFAWIDSLLSAIIVVFAGNISTMSTFIKELSQLELEQGLAYALSTVVAGLVVSLIPYVAIVR